MKAKNYCPEFEEYKTIRQWALLGQLPKKDAKGVELWANRNCQTSYVYYSPDEVVPATEKELQDFFQPEKERRREQARAYRKARLEREQEERERELEEAKWCAVEPYRKKIEELSIIINALDKDLSTAIAMNFEATGYEDEDELLQLSIINFKGDILFNSYFKPQKHKEWTETEKENGITPEMVANAPQISEMAKQIAEIFNKADLILYSKNYSYYWLFSWSNILIQPKYRREVNVNEMITESDNFELPKNSLEKCQAILKLYKEKLERVEEDK